MPKKKTASYEELKAKLDETVSRLSDETLTINEMMKLYDEGNRLAKECQKMLDSYMKALDDTDESESDQKIAPDDDDQSMAQEEL